MLSGAGEKTTEAHITLILLQKTKKTRAVMAVCLLINGFPFPGAGDLGNMKEEAIYPSAIYPRDSTTYLHV